MSKGKEALGRLTDRRHFGSLTHRVEANEGGQRQRQTLLSETRSICLEIHASTKTLVVCGSRGQATAPVS